MAPSYAWHIIGQNVHTRTRQEEIFVPILPVITVQAVDEAIAFCVCKPTPLAAYVFVRDPTVREKWLGKVASGGACVNDCCMHL